MEEEGEEEEGDVDDLDIIGPCGREHERLPVLAGLPDHDTELRRKGRVQSQITAGTVDGTAEVPCVICGQVPPGAHGDQPPSI